MFYLQHGRHDVKCKPSIWNRKFLGQNSDPKKECANSETNVNCLINNYNVIAIVSISITVNGQCKFGILLSRFTCMERCWKENPDERPSFKEIYTSLEKMLASNEVSTHNYASNVKTFVKTAKSSLLPPTFIWSRQQQKWLTQPIFCCFNQWNIGQI